MLVIEAYFFAPPPLELRPAVVLMIEQNVVFTPSIRESFLVEISNLGRICRARGAARICRGSLSCSWRGTNLSWESVVQLVAWDESVVGVCPGKKLIIVDPPPKTRLLVLRRRTYFYFAHTIIFSARRHNHLFRTSSSRFFC